jgi:hypothetical protein
LADSASSDVLKSGQFHRKNRSELNPFLSPRILEPGSRRNRFLCITAEGLGPLTGGKTSGKLPNTRSHRPTDRPADRATPETHRGRGLPDLAGGGHGAEHEDPDAGAGQGVGGDREDGIDDGAGGDGPATAAGLRAARPGRLGRAGARLEDLHGAAPGGRAVDALPGRLRLGARQARARRVAGAGGAVQGGRGRLPRPSPGRRGAARATAPPGGAPRRAGAR